MHLFAESVLSAQFTLRCDLVLHEIAEFEVVVFDQLGQLVFARNPWGRRHSLLDDGLLGLPDEFRQHSSFHLLQFEVVNSRSPGYVGLFAQQNALESLWLVPLVDYFLVFLYLLLL